MKKNIFFCVPKGSSDGDGFFFFFFLPDTFKKSKRSDRVLLKTTTGKMRSLSKTQFISIIIYTRNQNIPIMFHF